MLHVGAAPDQVPTAETPVCVHVSVMLEERKNVASHANVAIEPWLFVLDRVGALPSAGAVSASHVAIAHVGCAPEPLSHPLASHVSVGEPTRTYPCSHVYVATEPRAFVLLLETKSGVDTASVIPAVYAHELIAVHVGVAVSDHAPLAPHVTTAATPDASVKPSLHVYVSTVSYAPASEVSTVPSTTVRTPSACFAGALAHVTNAHVGALPLHVPAAAPAGSSCAHVCVTALDKA